MLTRSLIVGWFSFEQGHATAGDILSGHLVGEWLQEAGFTYDLALDPPFKGGVNWRTVNPPDYSHVIFVCGPFDQGELETQFFSRFAGCRLIGLNLTMLVSLEKWSPFDFLIERDSSQTVNADLVFLTSQPKVPVIGVCLVESYPGAKVNLANEAIQELLSTVEGAIVHIDTRLDINSVELRSSAEVESLIAKVDVLITTRLHGTVFALKNGIPVIAIDPEAGGAKIKRQLKAIEWPVSFVADDLDVQRLQQAFEYCLTEKAQQKAKQCFELAKSIVKSNKHRFVRTLQNSDCLEDSYLKRFRHLISVVIPCYKQAHFLEEAIESVIAQTYKNFEIIVVDDGSPDNTAEVAARYPVRYIRQENQGLSGARNTGIRESKGNYLVFLDADDRLTPNALQAGLNCFHAHPECAFVSGHHRYIKGDGSLLNEYPPEPIDDDYYQALLQRNYIGMHATVMYQRHIFEEIGDFDRTFPSCEDYDLYLRIARHYPVCRHDEMTAEYRWHDANMTRNSPRMLNSALKALKFQEEFIGNKAQYLHAYRRGIRFWRNYFAQTAIQAAIDNLKVGRFKDGSLGLLTLLKYFPAWLRACLFELQIYRRSWFS